MYTIPKKPPGAEKILNKCCLLLLALDYYFFLPTYSIVPSTLMKISYHHLSALLPLPNWVFSTSFAIPYLYHIFFVHEAEWFKLKVSHVFLLLISGVRLPHHYCSIQIPQHTRLFSSSHRK